VFPHGLSRPPLCIACALEAGGVRHQHTGRPKLPSREVRRRLQQDRDRPPDPEPVEVDHTETADPEEEGWLDGSVSAEEVGGWVQRY